MKTFTKNLIRTCIVLLLYTACVTTLAQNAFVTVTGTLKDAKTGEKIYYAAITVPNTGIGTVSNSDGEFTLKVNTSLNAEYFEVSHLGYATTRFKISEAAGKEKTYYLEIQPIKLQEINVLPKNAREIVEMALQNIKKNYSQVPDMMTGFYRESIRQRRNYLSVSEAVVDIYKAPYSNLQNDRVKIYKGRKGSNVKAISITGFELVSTNGTSGNFFEIQRLKSVIIMKKTAQIHFINKRFFLGFLR